MRFLFKLIILLGIGTVIGIIIYRDPGLAMFQFQQTIVQMPLWLAAVALVLIGFVIYFISATFRVAHNAGKGISNFMLRRKLKLAKETTLSGLIELKKGHWKKAEKLLKQGVKHNKQPLVNYLSLAEAAQAQGLPNKRNDYLKLAHMITKPENVAVALTEARLQYEQKEYLATKDTLSRILKEFPNHPATLSLLLDVQIALNDYEAQVELIPKMFDLKILDQHSNLNISKNAYRQYFSDAKFVDSAKLIDLFDLSPKVIQEDEAIFTLFISKLIKLEEYDLAEKLTYKALKKHWYPSWVHIYGLIKSSHLDKQLQHAENWYKRNQGDANLMLTLGRLAMYNELWGKARDYLQNAIDHGANTEAHLELGRLLRHLGEHMKAEELFREGLMKSLPYSEMKGW